MATKYVIEVTQEDILQGANRDCVNCPIARAVRRATGNKCLRVGKFSIWDQRQVDADGIPLPVVAKKWIAGFDSGYPVEPFAFEIEVP